MVTFETVWQLVAAVDREVPAVREFMLATGPKSGATEFGPGQSTAGETLSSFLVRREASRLAGLEEVGLDQSIQRLELLDAIESVLLFHWHTADSVFTVLVSERTAAFVGCVRVRSPLG